MFRNKRFLSALWLVACTYSSIAQYGNEWINFNQEYFKLKVAEEGVYRVTAAELEAQGFQANIIAANRLRLYRNGQEVAMLVSSSGGILNYLEFYGQQNDGFYDRDLYVSAEAQPHNLYSLFSDTSTYFLTYELAAGGSNIDFSTDNDNTGLTAESYHTQKALQLQTTTYSPGLLFSQDSKFSLSQYDFGEGWTGSAVGKGGSQSYTFQLDNAATSGPNPTVDMVMIGGNGQTHVVDISVGPDENNTRSIGSQTWSDRTSTSFSLDLLWSDVSSTGQLVVRMTVVGLDGISDRAHTSFVRVNYPQTFALNSGEQKTFFLESNTANKSYLQISSDASSTTRFFDITDPINPIRLNSNALTSTVDVVVNNTSSSRNIFGFTSTKTVPDISRYTFNQIDFSNSNYIIVSHPSLRSAEDGTDPIASYEAYRESEAGGSWDVQVANIQDVYDQFLFGIPSPLAIRRMVDYGYTQGQLSHLFLVGKGLTVNANYTRNPNAAHFIPTYGLPGSDLFYGVGFNGTLNPRIGIGRITARTPEEIQAYLNKVIQSEALPYNSLWRKNILQLTGGQNQAELTLFKSYAEGFSALAENDFAGASTTSVSKETTATVEFINIREEVNQGLSMITFFGHSGSAVTDIEVDQPDVYDNEGRYPAMFLVNGCNAGEIFTTGQSFGEPWILTANRGSTGFMAHTNFALSSGLRRFTDLFYEIAFADTTTFGSSLGQIVKEVAVRYFATNTTNTAQTQVFQMVLQSDPATKLFDPENPDYSIEADNVNALPIFGERVLASQDSFKVELIVQNFGRSVNDSLTVSVDHTLPNGEVLTYSQQFERVLYQDTLEIFIPNTVGQNIEGNNIISVLLDPSGEQQELDETNNQVTKDLFISNGNTFPLLPLDKGVVASEDVRFVWQRLATTDEEITFEFQLDTASDFSSSFLVSSSDPGVIFVEKQVNLSAIPDSTVVYWRTRVANASNALDSLWSEVSFTLIRSSTALGWGTFSQDQFSEATLDGIEYDESTAQWRFRDTSGALEITTFGPNSGLSYSDIVVSAVGVDLITTSNLPDPVCRSNTINAVAFDRQTSNPYLPIEFGTVGTSNSLVCGRLPQLIHNFTESNVLGSGRWLETLIDAMAVNDEIVLFNIDSVTYSNWDDQLKTKLEEIGIASSTINGLVDGQPVIFFGKKGQAAGTATAILTDNSGRAATEQILQFVGQSNGVFTDGSIQSQLIGPATNWRTLNFDLGTEASDSFSFNVVGVSGNTEQTLFTSARTEEIDLSSVDASQFPNIRLDFNFTDATNSTPPQPRYWHVLYDFPPDGLLIMPDNSLLSLQEGDSLVRDVYFYNYSDQDFTDSITFTGTLLSTNGATSFDISEIMAGPSAGDSTLFQLNTGTVGRVGNFNLSVRSEAQGEELYTVNNSLTRASFLTVEPDNLNPVLDVTFDGAYILNGDIVAPQPLINILLKDQNPVLRKSDTTGISVELRVGDEGQFVRVPFTNPEINYTPATEDTDFIIEYRPGPLEDGRYALRVQATDESGNAAGTEPYEISFEVVNESSITHFYPYPNPFSTSTRFVFTLTGSEVPDQLKIQIMTVTGRVVREILQDEIGPIKIGNNISQYAWDGRDEFGDQLANGVYLYRVITKINGEDIKNRGTAADQAFKNGFGKLYILR